VRAFGYVRLSKDTEDTHSPAVQRDAIGKLCADRGWDLVEMFEDIDVSAWADKKRPAFSRMMDRLGETDCIVFRHLDRLTRSTVEAGQVAKACQAAGVNLVATDMDIDTTTANGKLTYTILMAVGEHSSDMTSERSRAMMANKRKNGEWVGARPYGWRIVGKHLEPDKDEQAVLQEMARRYVDGEAIHAIARDYGRRSSAVSKMLHSDRVIEALPDDLSGPLVEALLTRRRDRVPVNRKSLLGGLATCHLCGDGLSLASSRGGRAEGRWYTYRCPKVGHIGISGPWLEEYVTEAVLDYIDTPRLLEAIKRQRKVRPTRKVSAIEKRMELLDAQLVEGKVSAARFDRMNGALLEQLKEAQTTERQRGIDLPTELARGLREKWPTLPVSVRRRIIAAVVESITVAKAEGHGPIDPERVKIAWRT
jgi:site-specific DNA recombinase